MSGNSRAPHREIPLSATLDIWVQPGASRQRIVGMHADAVKVAVTAPPEKGAANRAVELLAEEFGLAASAVRVIAGGGSRRKRICLQGVGPDQVRAWVERCKSPK